MAGLLGKFAFTNTLPDTSPRIINFFPGVNIFSLEIVLVFQKNNNFSFHLLFSDDPLDKELYHALLLEDKVCDVISKWETALREKGMGKFENNRVIRFVYQNRLFWRKNVSGEVDRERMLFAYQISKQIVQGKFPVNKELAFELTALMAQVSIQCIQL